VLPGVILFLRQAAVSPPHRMAVKVDMRIALLLWLSSLLHAQTVSPQPPRTVHSEGVVAMATISGVVLDASGKPYAGAWIWTTAASEPPTPETWDGHATDAQGRFRLTVAPGSYLVCALPPGVGLDETKIALPACFPSAPAYHAATAVTVGAHGASPQLTIRLREAPTYSIRGRITSGGVLKTKDWGMTIDAGSDHSQQHLGCGSLPPMAPYSSACEIWYTGDVTADGSFVISGVPAGSYTLDAMAGDYVGRQYVVNDDLGMPPPASVPPVYTGARNVIVKGNLSGVLVKVKLEVDDHAPQR
jgi:hypothetical protein